MATVSIPLSSRKYPGLVALIDEEDLPLVQGYNWCWSHGYASAYVPGSGREHQKHVRMHRLIMGAPPDFDADHRDGDCLNNTRDNLRLARKTQNMSNTKVRRTSKSGYKGVSWDAARRLWMARVHHGNKVVHIGRFATAEEAAHAYDTAARLHHGDFARLNFP